MLYRLKKGKFGRNEEVKIMCLKIIWLILQIALLLVVMPTYVIPGIAMGEERLSVYEMKSIGGEQIDWDCKAFCQPTELCPAEWSDGGLCCKYGSDTDGVGPHNACVQGTQLTSCGQGTLKNCTQQCTCVNEMWRGQCIGCNATNCNINSQLYSDC